MSATQTKTKGGELTLSIVSEITDEFQIKEVVGRQTVIIELRVNKEDLGKVIGKNGACINAIRTILEACGAKEGKKYFLEIIE